MIILTLFGTTVGLELQYFPLSNPSPTLKFEEAWIGVTPSQLKLRSDKDSVVVLRKSVNEHQATWIGIYRPAREMGYERPGGFYGAGVWIIDHVADASLLTALLSEMANQIQAKTMNGDCFVKKIADVRNEFTPPSQVKSILASLTKVNSGFKPGGESAFIVEVSNAIDIIEWAQRAQSANHFSKAVLGTLDQIPDVGLSSAFRLFPSHSLAIEAAYQNLASESRSNKLEADNNINYINNQLVEKDKEINALTEAFEDKVNQLKRYEEDRDRRQATMGQYTELQIEVQKAQNSLSMFKFDDDNLINFQTTALREQHVTSNDSLSTSNARRTGNANGRMASGANPNGHAKPRHPSQLPDSDSENHQGPDMEFPHLGIPILIVCLFVVIAIVLIGYFKRDNEHGCTIYKINCQLETDRPIPQNSNNSSFDGPRLSEQPQGTGIGSQKP